MLKAPRKPRAKTEVTELRDVLRDAKAEIKDLKTGLDSPNKLVKALKTPVNTESAYTLHALLKKDIGVRGIQDYVSFIKQEWHTIKSFAPNYGARTSNRMIPFTLSALVEYYSIIISLFKTYTKSEAEYLGRVGLLEQWEVDLKDKEANLPQKIEELRLLNKRAAKQLQANKKIISQLKKDVSQYKEYSNRLRPFAMLCIDKLGGGMDVESFMRYAEGTEDFDYIKDVPKHLEGLFESLEKRGKHK